MSSRPRKPKTDRCSPMRIEGYRIIRENQPGYYLTPSGTFGPLRQSKIFADTLDARDAVSANPGTIIVPALPDTYVVHNIVRGYLTKPGSYGLRSEAMVFSSLGEAERAAAFDDSIESA